MTPRTAPVPPAPDDRGQAAVELALVLPLIAVLLAALVQVGLVARDQILLVHAAREAVREAAVREPGQDQATARRSAAAATGNALQPDRLTLRITRSGGRVGVRAGYRAPIRLPIVRNMARDVPLAAYAQARAEK